MKKAKGDENMEERKQRARKSFKDHKAKIISQTDDFFIADWRNKNGSGDYAVRYILDIKKGNLIVSGDLGDSIASWYNEVVPQKLKHYLNDVNYYIGKLQCASDKYTYHLKDIKEDLEKIKQETLSENYDPEYVEEDFEEMYEILQELNICENSTFPDELTDLFEKYAEPWYESSFCDIGKRVDQRIYLWAVGFQMVCEQLNI